MIASHNCRRRRGFGLLEMAVTGVLIVVALTVTVQVIGWVALERKAVERRERALLEVQNLLERFASRPWDELTAESASKVRISEASNEFLRRPTLDLKLTVFDDAPPRKKIVAEIRWPDRSGRPEAPVRLVAWIYHKGDPIR